MKGKKYINIILFNDSFPIGQASANRILSLSKGLIENGISTKIFILRPTENDNNVININKRGVYEGVEFEYISQSTIKSNKYWVKVLQLFFARLKLALLIFRQRKIVRFIFYPLDSFWLLLLVRSLLIYANVKIVRHVDEFPPYILTPEKFSIFGKFFHKYLFYRLVDAVVPMTKKLEIFYKSIGPKDIPFIHLPMTVELERFINVPKSDQNIKYITYCGNLGHNNKDGLPDLINAFSIVCKNINNVKLKIIGSSKNENDILRLKSLVKDKEIVDRVIFTGKISRPEIPYHLCNSKILVLSRPDNKQAEGGFPTKLGEYLATGNPVVVTNVGEINEYLKDRVSAFISEPNNYEDFSRKMIEALTDDELAIKVGKEGQKVAVKSFNYKAQGKTLADFLKKL